MCPFASPSVLNGAFRQPGEEPWRTARATEGDLTNNQVDHRVVLVMDVPLTAEAAKRLIREILKTGRFTYSKHARDEMLADDLTTVDCENVLRGGVVRPGEREHGTWRYRVETSRIAIVIAFRSERELVVVTAWRSGR